MHGFIKLYISAVLLLFAVFSASRQTASSSIRKDVVAAKTTGPFEADTKASHRSPRFRTTDDVERCPHPFNFSCYYQSVTLTSHCECIYPTRAESTIMHKQGITKRCNADMSKCAYLYETGNGCRKDWKFKCSRTEMPGFDWECSCEGWSGEREECPAGYMGVDRWCWRFWYYRSMFAESVEPLRRYTEVGSDVAEKVLIEQDSLS